MFTHLFQIGEIDNANYRFYLANNYSFFLGILLHLAFIPFFYFINATVLMYFNIFSVLTFTTAYILNRKGQHTLGTVFVSSEIIIHATLAIYFIGWDSGFFYYLLAVIPLLFYNPNTSNIQKIFLAIIVTTFYLALKYYSDIHSPVILLETELSQYLYFINSFFLIFIIAALTYFFSLASEISEHKINQARKQADIANQAKSLFLANMSHEIRTPMNGMLSLIQVLNTTELDEKQREYLQSIDRAGGILMSLIDDLLDLSRIESGKLEINAKAFKLWEFIEDILLQTEYLFDEKDVLFNVDINNELPVYLITDDVRLKQVVINLINNSVKFTHRGEVNFIINGDKIDENNFKLHIEVSDTGMGIPEDKIESIFEPFQQLSPTRIYNRGVGLGLPICKKIIDALGGTIKIDSVEGKGSCFTLDFTFPIAEKSETNKEKVVTTIALEPITLLLVEDDQISRLAVKAWFKDKGHKIIIAENGKQAVDYLQENDVDVILMDVHMPKMNGIEATKIIKGKNLSRAPIIGMTASVMNDERKSYIEAGMDVLVEKPLNFENIMGIVKNKINK